MLISPRGKQIVAAVSCNIRAASIYVVTPGERLLTVTISIFKSKAFNIKF